MSIDEAAAKTSSAITTWGPLGINALLTIGLFILGYWLNGQAVAQAAFNNRLTTVEQAEASTQTDVRVIQSSMQTRASARDQQVSAIGGQVSSLSGRVDRVESSFDDKLDKVVDGVSNIKSQVAALLAIARQPP